LGRTEQDRIFNELVAAHLVLIMLVLVAPDLRVPSSMRDHLTGLRDLVPKAYVDTLRDLGVEGEHLLGWDKLLTLRYEEYAKDRHGVRPAAMQLEARERPLGLDELSRIQLLVPVQAVALGCHQHICKGETDNRDELFRLMLTALTKFFIGVRLRLEGGKPSLLMRMKLFFRRTMAGGR
jgi:hypothetical protein